MKAAMTYERSDCNFSKNREIEHSINICKINLFQKKVKAVFLLQHCDGYQFLHTHVIQLIIYA